MCHCEPKDKKKNNVCFFCGKPAKEAGYHGVVCGSLCETMVIANCQDWDRCAIPECNDFAWKAVGYTMCAEHDEINSKGSLAIETADAHV